MFLSRREVITRKLKEFLSIATTALIFTAAIVAIIILTI